MTRLPPNVIARIREKARREDENDLRSGEREKLAPLPKLDWSDATLRAPTEGHVDVVRFPRTKR